jgi:integrase
LKNHLIPQFGRYKLREITKADVQAFMGKLLETLAHDGNLRRRVIYPTCDRLRIPRVSWHGFRHLHSSLLAYLGIPVSVPQAQLGHADPRITLEIYTHMASGAQREAVERLERFLLFPSCSQIVAEPASKMVN